MPLKVTVTKSKEDTFIVSPVGSIDSLTYIDLDKKIETILLSTPKTIVFDMKGVAYISSMGLSVVFKTRKALEANGGSLIVMNLQPQVKKVFDIVEALRGMRIFANMEEVEKYIDAMQREDDLGTPPAK